MEEVQGVGRVTGGYREIQGDIEGYREYRGIEGIQAQGILDI